MNRDSRLEDLLRKAFNPTFFALENQSADHKGHAHGGTDTHYALRMVSKKFDQLSRVERQREVMTALHTEFESGLHALTMVLLSPKEAQS